MGFPLVDGRACYHFICQTVPRWKCRQAGWSRQSVEWWWRRLDFNLVFLSP